MRFGREVIISLRKASSDVFRLSDAADAGSSLECRVAAALGAAALTLAASAARKCARE